MAKDESWYVLERVNESGNWEPVETREPTPRGYAELVATGQALAKVANEKVRVISLTTAVLTNVVFYQDGRLADGN